MQPRAPKSSHTVMPLSDDIEPAITNVPELASADPEHTKKGYIPTPEGARPRYVATYIDGAQLDRDNKAIDASIERQKNRHIMAIHVIGIVLTLASAAFAVYGLVTTNPILSICSTIIVAIGIGISLRQQWPLAILKLILMLLVFAAAIFVMIGNWTGVGPGMSSVPPIAVLFIIFASILSYLSEERVKSLLY